MEALPARLDDQQLARVEAYSVKPLPALPKADRNFMLQFTRMLSDMPRQQADDVSAEVKLDNMVRLLGHLPRATLSWVADEAHRRLTFYPSIKELLDLSREWTRGDESVIARARAARLARDERNARLDDARRSLRLDTFEQSAIDVLPNRIKQILESEGLLRLGEDGGYTARRQLEPEADDELGEMLSRLGSSFPSNRAAA